MRRVTAAVRSMRSVSALVALLAALVGCSSAPEAAPASAAPTPVPAPTSNPDPSVAADREVCIDLDASGGALYRVFVVPMMAGPSGQKGVDVEIAQIIPAVSMLTELGDGALASASSDIADEGDRLVAAAEAFAAYQHADGTALLTAFVGLAVACQEAGHKPSWFDAAALAS